MRTRPLHPTLALVAACSISILSFLLGISLSPAHFWGLYFLPIVIVFLWGRRRDIYIVAVVAGVLLVAEYWAEAAPSTHFLANHLLPLVVLWGVAWLLVQRRQLQDELDEQAKVRTAALAAREEQLAKIFRANPGGMAITRRSDGCFLEVNDAYLAMVGYAREELIGHTIVELGILSAESRAGVTEALQAQGSLRGRELRLINARREPIDIYYSSEEIDVDSVPCYLGLMVDITAHKRLEEALRDSEERFRLIVENSPDVITLFDEQGNMVYVSPAFEGTHGAAAKAALALDPLLVDAIHTPPGEGPRADELARARTRPQFAGRRMAAEAVAYCLAHPGTKHRVEIATPLPSGEIRHYDIAYQAYRRTGGNIQVVSITRDVTERKQLEEALAASEAQLRAAYQRLQLAVDAANIGIWTWNLADGSLEWDDRMCELYGVLPEEHGTGLYYELWRARVHPDDRDLAEPSHGDPVHSRSPWSTTFRIVLPGGSIRHIQVNAIKELDGDGQPLRMIGVNRDVTDQKHYELVLRDANAVLEQRVAERTADLQAALAEVEAASLLKDEFMAMISHELRTPITGVLTLTELLEMQLAGPLTGRQINYVQGIAESGAQLLYVVNSILGYTHLLSGKVQLNAGPCDLGRLLTASAAAQQHKAAAKGQTIAVAVAPPDLAINADPTALAEVLARLLDNAVKFTPEGGRIGLEAHSGAAQGTVDLDVWDTGIGISPKQAEHIFKPFVQADGSLARSKEGMGLGLAYVDQMVRLMGGTLHLESTPGLGSRFRITLPA